jgi:hypothetical protein
MKGIYESAQEVLVCLSTPELTGPGMKWLRELVKAVPEEKGDVPIDGSLWTTDSINRHDYRLLQYLKSTIRRNTAPPKDSWPYTDCLPGWADFCRMIESPWWSRAWVFQEFIASSEAVFLYGQGYMGWKPLLKILIPLRSISLALRSRFSLGKLDFDRRWRQMISKNWNTDPKALETALSLLQCKLELKPPIGPLNLLRHSRKCQASDLRDKVYAFFGLADPHYGIIPDYSPRNTLDMVFTETTRRIILHENKLDILAHAPMQSGYLDASSWVVDWTTPEPEMVQYLTKIDFEAEGFSGDKWLQANATFRSVLTKQSGREARRMGVNVFGKQIGVVTRVLRKASRPSHAYVLGDTVQINCFHTVKAGDWVWALYGCSYLVVVCGDVEATANSGRDCFRFISMANSGRLVSKDRSWGSGEATRLLAAAANERPTRQITLV